MNNDNLYLSFPQDRNGIKNDYSYSDCIFELEGETTDLYLKTYSLNNQRFLARKKIKVTEEELMKNYLSLEEFLNNAEYVGKVAYRTKPTIHGDNSFINSDNDYYTVVLYKGDRHLIIAKLRRDNTERIEILNESYVDNNWVYIGDSINLYSDKDVMLSKLKSLIIKEDAPIRK